jgi:hypothetical protein
MVELWGRVVTAGAMGDGVDRACAGEDGCEGGLDRGGWSGVRLETVILLFFRLGWNAQTIASPSRNTGPAPVKLRIRNRGPATEDSALPEFIGRTSFLPLRPESKGIAPRLGRPWLLLCLSLDRRSKSSATRNVPSRLCLGKIPLVDGEFRWSCPQEDGDYPTILVQKSGLPVSDFLIVGNTKSVTIGASFCIPVSLCCMLHSIRQQSEGAMGNIWLGIMAAVVFRCAGKAQGHFAIRNFL